MITVYALRHKATGVLMPEMKGGRGYSQWSPGKPHGVPSIARSEFRIFYTTSEAEKAMAHWARGVSTGESGGAVDAGRLIDDLDIVMYELTQVSA